MRRLKKFALMATFFALLGALFVPTLAFAISHDGSGSPSGGGGGGGGSGSWNFDDSSPKGEKPYWFNAGPDYTAYQNKASWGTGQAYWDLTQYSNYLQGYYIVGGGKLCDVDWVNLDWLMPQTNCTFYVNGAGSNIAEGLAGWAKEQANEDGYKLGADPYQPGLWYNPDKGKYLDAVIYCEAAPEGTWVPWYSYQDKVTWEEDGAPGATTVNYGEEEWYWSLENKYRYAADALTYQHTTPPQNVTDSFTVDAYIQTIQQVQWYWVQNDEWTLYPEWTEYHLVRTNEYKKTINYNASTPDISPEYYCPLNVNRQDYAQVGDYGITSAYVSGHYVDGPGGGFVASKKLDASVTNSQNKTNNAALETLDLNADTNFTVTFNNDVLGLDASKNWNNAPPALAYGDWEYSSGGAYANGRTLPGDDFYRYNLSLAASISTASGKPRDTASIVVNGQEYIASETYRANTPSLPL